MRKVFNYRPSGATLVVLVAFLIAAGGIAYASIPSPSGVIRGCYTTTGTHTLQVIDSGTRGCPGNTTSLNWNQKGPKGATGPAGPKGPAGGFKGLYRLGFRSKSNNAHSKKVTLRCQGNDLATGGGYQIIGGVDGRVATRSLPVGDPPNGWQAKAFNTIAPAGKTWRLKVWVVCARV
jgi:hypothetical protein